MSKSNDEVFTKALSEAEEEMTQVLDSNRAILKKHNRIDCILFGGIAVMYLGFIIVGIVVQDWESLLLPIILLMWLGWTFLLTIEVNYRRFTNDVQRELNQIERKNTDLLIEQLDGLVADLEKDVVKAKKAAKGTK